MATTQSYTPVTTSYFSRLLIDSGVPENTADFCWVYSSTLKTPYLEYEKNLRWQKFRAHRTADGIDKMIPAWSMAKLISMLPDAVDAKTVTYNEETDCEEFLLTRCELYLCKAHISYDCGDVSAFSVDGDFNKCVIKTVAWLAESGHIVFDSGETHAKESDEEEYM